jgi:hypothetical protein
MLIFAGIAVEVCGCRRPRWRGGAVPKLVPGRNKDHCHHPHTRSRNKGPYRGFVNEYLVGVVNEHVTYLISTSTSATGLAQCLNKTGHEHKEEHAGMSVCLTSAQRSHMCCGGHYHRNPCIHLTIRSARGHVWLMSCVLQHCVCVAGRNGHAARDWFEVHEVFIHYSQGKGWQSHTP